MYLSSKRQALNKEVHVTCYHSLSDSQWKHVYLSSKRQALNKEVHMTCYHSLSDSQWKHVYLSSKRQALNKEVHVTCYHSLSDSQTNSFTNVTCHPASTSHRPCNNEGLTLHCRNVTWKQPLKVRNLKPLSFFSFLALECEKIFIKMHSTESRCVIGPETIPFVGVSVHLSGWKFYRLR